MGDVHRLPTAPDASVRLLERAVADAIAGHPDARVAARWSALARASIARHPGPPAPTRPVLDLDGLGALPAPAREAVARAADAWLTSYLEDVRAELLTMHRDAFALQRRVAELEVRLEDAAAGAATDPSGRSPGRPSDRSSDRSSDHQSSDQS